MIFLKIISFRQDSLPESLELKLHNPIIPNHWYNSQLTHQSGNVEMSEYIEIETEMSDDGTQMFFYTNLRLAEGAGETYHSSSALEVGSPVAQALAVVAGIVRVEIDGRDLIVTRDHEVDWHVIVADVSAALKDFFL